MTSADRTTARMTNAAYLLTKLIQHLSLTSHITIILCQYTLWKPVHLPLHLYGDTETTSCMHNKDANEYGSRNTVRLFVQRGVSHHVPFLRV